MDFVWSSFEFCYRGSRLGLGRATQSPKQLVRDNEDVARDMTELSRERRRGETETG